MTQKFPFLDQYKPHGAAIDFAHAVIILGSLVSSKPENVLEIGIGTGSITNILLNGIDYNQIGKLTCIDNFHDLGGNLPKSTLENLKTKNINIIAPIEEKDFVFSQQENTYDFLVSDGDHLHSGEWVDQMFSIIKPNSFMFFHDVNNPDYINLMNYKLRADELNKPNYLFTKSSRPDENCSRGLLMVINTK